MTWHTLIKRALETRPLNRIHCVGAKLLTPVKKNNSTAVAASAQRVPLTAYMTARDREQHSPRAATRAANTAAAIAIAATPSRIEFPERGAHALEMRRFFLMDRSHQGAHATVENACEMRA